MSSAKSAQIIIEWQSTEILVGMDLDSQRQTNHSSYTVWPETSTSLV